MKKVALTVVVTCLTFVASAVTSTSDNGQSHGYTTQNVAPVQTVPETTPTLALSLISLAAAGAMAAYWRRRSFRSPC